MTSIGGTDMAFDLRAAGEQAKVLIWLLNRLLDTLGDVAMNPRALPEPKLFAAGAQDTLLALEKELERVRDRMFEASREAL